MNILIYIYILYTVHTTARFDGSHQFCKPPHCKSGESPTCPKIAKQMNSLAETAAIPHCNWLSVRFPCG